MNIAGFDLATVSGFVALDGTKVLEARSYRAPGKSHPEIFNAFRYTFRDFLQDHDVREAAIEQPLVTPMWDQKKQEMFPKSNMQTYLLLYGLRAHALEVLKSLGIKPREVHQMTWRKAFTGNPRATKEHSLAIAQQISPAITSMDAAEAMGVAWWLNGQLKQEQLLRGRVA